MSKKHDPSVTLAFKLFDPKVDQLVFDANYRITVERTDGRGLTEIEAETAVNVYAMSTPLGRKEKRGK